MSGSKQNQGLPCKESTAAAISCQPPLVRFTPAPCTVELEYLYKPQKETEEGLCQRHNNHHVYRDLWEARWESFEATQQTKEYVTLKPHLTKLPLKTSEVRDPQQSRRGFRTNKHQHY